MRLARVDYSIDRRSRDRRQFVRISLLAIRPACETVVIARVTGLFERRSHVLVDRIFRAEAVLERPRVQDSLAVLVVERDRQHLPLPDDIHRGRGCLRRKGLAGLILGGPDLIAVELLAHRRLAGRFLKDVGSMLAVVDRIGTGRLVVVIDRDRVVAFVHDVRERACRKAGLRARLAGQVCAAAQLDAVDLQSAGQGGSVQRSAEVQRIQAAAALILHLAEARGQVHAGRAADLDYLRESQGNGDGVAKSVRALRHDDVVHHRRRRVHRLDIGLYVLDHPVVVTVAGSIAPENQRRGACREDQSAVAGAATSIELLGRKIADAVPPGIGCRAAVAAVTGERHRVAGV